MSSSDRNRFGLGRVRVSLIKFRPGSGRVIMSGQTLTALVVPLFAGKVWGLPTYLFLFLLLYIFLVVWLITQSTKVASTLSYLLF